MAEKTPRREHGGSRSGHGPGHGGPGAQMAVVKAKDIKGTLKRLTKYLMPQKFTLIFVTLLAVISTVFSVVGPKMMGLATTKLSEGFMAQMAHLSKLNDAIAGGKGADVIDAIKAEAVAPFDLEYVGKILLLLLILYIISSAFLYLTGYLMAGVAQKTVYNMRSEIKEKLDKIPIKYFDTHTNGDILSRVANDMDNISNTLQQSLMQLISSLVTIVGTLLMMIFISPLLALVAIISLPLTMLFVILITKNSQKFFRGQQKAIGELNGHVEEMLTGHKIVKGFGYEQKSVETFERINNEYYNIGWKAQFFSGLIMPAAMFVSNLGYVAVCILGGIMVAHRAVTVGDVQAFIMYVRNFSQPISQIANIMNSIQSAIASAERVFEVMDEVEEVPEAASPVVPSKVEGNVRFEHVEFGYSSEHILMQDLCIDVKAGNTVAIVGPTGAGKTTLINLLMRFYEISKGSIKVDGIDITSMKRSDLRNTFGMVLQDTWLFNGTIFDNIKYGREDATDDEVYAAAKAAYADNFIRQLPHGYNEMLNEEASNISQGQKQLITIARAILSQPEILILDEATSNVDTRTEVLIQKAMDKLMQGRTNFVIAHRLSTIKNSDLILVMKQGTIIEQGTHTSLLNDGGFYSELYNSQFASA